MSKADTAKEVAMDWEQVVQNGGPPCFYVEGPQYCGRAERWGGHGNPAFHNYVSLTDLLTTASQLAFERQSEIERMGNVIQELAEAALKTRLERDAASQLAWERGRQESAKVANDAGAKWKDKAQARKSKTYAAYVLAALDLEGRIRALTYAPAEEKKNG